MTPATIPATVPIDEFGSLIASIVKSVHIDGGFTATVARTLLHHIRDETPIPTDIISEWIGRSRSSIRKSLNARFEQGTDYFVEKAGNGTRRLNVSMTPQCFREFSSDICEFKTMFGIIDDSHLI